MNDLTANLTEQEQQAWNAALAANACRLYAEDREARIERELERLRREVGTIERAEATIDAAIYARQEGNAELEVAAAIWMHASARLLEAYEFAGRPNRPYAFVMDELKARLGLLRQGR
jgi:hypothetical protein